MGPRSPPDNKEAVIAIQGGGIFALPMIGQARAILAAGYVPLAFAGSSGGAILAALLWSGLTPNRIEQAFVDALTADKNALTDLLLPSNPLAPPLTFAGLGALMARAERLQPLPSGAWSLLTYPTRKLGTLRALAGPVGSALSRRGLFCGERLRVFLERLIREGLEIDQSQKMPVTFGQAKQVTRARRPPLLLTTTNVSGGKLELIDSTDPAYAGVSIAAAVRASAGFPIFFEPVDLTGVAGGRCFVDGGMIANFPLWAFSRAFRTKLQQRKDYGWLAPRPWLPIGIRVVDLAEDRDVARPRAYLQRLAEIAAGMARNEIEDRLVGAALSHALIIRQDAASLPLHPVTGKPLGVLDVSGVTIDNIREIVATGDLAAEAELAALGHYAVYDDACGSSVAAELEALVKRCEHAMHRAPAELRMRANIFIAVGRELHLCFGARMQGKIDEHLKFPDLATGVAGWCYQTRSPVICNLGDVAKAATSGQAFSRPFRMDSAMQGQVDPQLTWLISYPIFDLRERQPLDAPVSAPLADTIAVHRLRAEHVGPILGIVNVDAVWDYEQIELDRNPYFHSHDPRIVAIVDAVAQSSLRLARLLVGISATEDAR